MLLKIHRPVRYDRAKWFWSMTGRVRPAKSKELSAPISNAVSRVVFTV